MPGETHDIGTKTVPKFLGNLAVQKQMVTEDQVQECLRIQAEEDAEGKPRRKLGDILIEKGYLKSTDVEALLQAKPGPVGPPRFGKYELLGKIGQGGMGVVYRAKLAHSTEVRALKVISSRAHGDPDFIKRFKREAKVTMGLDHPHIILTVDSGEVHGVPFMAMELLPGGNLEDRLQREGPLAEAEALHLIRDVAAALCYANEKGIVHRDVKPENIMFDATGKVKLADFGLVKTNDPNSSFLTEAGHTVGTPHYISPEQIRGEGDLDSRADIYSLGATLYRTVTGQTPYQGESPLSIVHKQLHDPLPPPDDLNPDLSDDCVFLIEKMMAKDRRDRHADPAELIRDIESILLGKTLDAKLPLKGRSTVMVSRARMERYERKRQALVEPPTLPEAPAPRIDTTKPLLQRAANQEGAYPVQPAEVLPIPLEAEASKAQGRPPRALQLPVGVYLLVGAVAVLVVAVGLLLFVPEGRAGQGAAGSTSGTATAGNAPPAVTGPSARVPASSARSGSAAGKPSLETPVVGGSARPAAAGSAAELEEMLGYVRAWERDHPSAFDELVERYRKVTERAKGSTLEFKIEDQVRGLVAAVESRRAVAAEAEWARLQAQVADSCQRQDYDEALAVLARIPAVYAGPLRERSGVRTGEVRGKAEALLAGYLEAARKELAAGQRDSARRSLEEAAKVRFQPGQGPVKELAAQLEKEELAAQKASKDAARKAAVDRLEGWLARFDEVLRGVSAGPGSVPKPWKERVEAARAVLGQAVAEPGADLLRAQWEEWLGCSKLLDSDSPPPTTASAKVEPLRSLAAAWRILYEFGAAGDAGSREATLAETEALLQPQAGHWLGKRLLAQLEEQRRGLLRQKVQAVWHERMGPYLKPGLKWTPREAQAAAAVLRELRQQAKGQLAALLGGGESGLDEVEQRIRKSLVEATPQTLKLLFHGQIRALDLFSRTIDLFYDFDEEDQAQDWVESFWAHQNLTQGSMRMRQGALWFSGTGRMGLLQGRFDSVAVQGDFLTSGQPTDYASLVVCGDPRGSGYVMAGAFSKAQMALGKLVHGVPGNLLQFQPVPPGKVRSGSIAFAFENGRLTGHLGAQRLQAEDKALSSGQVGIWAPNAMVAFDNLRVRGVLHAGWLKQALEDLWLAGSGRVVDLLPLIDPVKDAVKGRFVLHPGPTITAWPQPFAVLQLPYLLPEAYEIEMEPERVNGTDALVLDLMLAGKRFHLTLDGEEGNCSFLQSIDGKRGRESESAYDKPVLSKGRRSLVRCRVADGRVEVEVDGLQIISWKSDPQRLSSLTDTQLPVAGTAGLRWWGQTSYKIHRLVLRNLVGEGRPLR